MRAPSRARPGQRCRDGQPMEPQRRRHRLRRRFWPNVSAPCSRAVTRKAGREWTTRSQIIEAEPGSSFAFLVGGTEKGIVRWRWNLSAQGHGTLVEQSRQLLRIDRILGSNRGDRNALRDHMTQSVEVTLARW